jgi:hypothetical protein
MSVCVYSVLVLSCVLVSCSAYVSTLKKEAMCSSETTVDFQRTTRRYIPEDSAAHSHRCENLRYYRIEVSYFMFIVRENFG